jgi:hypothetical protein
VIETAEHKRIVLDGDQPTRKCRTIRASTGSKLRRVGISQHLTNSRSTQHTRALVVMQSGKPKMITYWCDVCYIRAYAPGPCVCCQKDTDLELRDLDDIR